jgi:ATP-dependent Lon protease
VLDEVDKMSMDFRGDPSAALMEVLDPELNHAFTDHYLDVEYDLSKVMFICTANVLHTIPQPLQDRMEVLRIPGYTEQEKHQIAKRFLVPKQLEATGLTEENLKFTDEGLTHIIRHYTHEAGVRNLEREIANVCRKVARKVVKEGKELHRRVTPANVNDFPRRHQVPRNSGPKRKTKSAWPPAWRGPKWAARCSRPKPRLMQGKGRLTLTGKLGDVMQESAQAAMSYVRSRSHLFGLPQDFYRHIDIHMHVPEGAIPKDGPSAGITLCTSIVSALTRIPVRCDLAMTGEITLRGKVLPIGGVKEKLLAAHRSACAP